MQFTAITVLLIAVASVVASPLETRQSANIQARFYPNNGCSEPSTGVIQYFDQINPGVCQNATIFTTYGSVYFDQNTIRRTIRFFNKPCGQENSANYFDIGPNTPNIPGCMTQQILSFETI